MRRYVAQLIGATRQHSQVALGAGEVVNEVLVQVPVPAETLAATQNMP